MRICSGAGCLRVVPDNVRYCTECLTDKQTPAPNRWQVGKEDPIVRQYQSERWRRLTPIVLKRCPVCAECRQALSRVVDHNIPARLIVSVCRAERLFIDSWAGFYIAANLRGMCDACHNAKSLKEDGQDWREELDRILAPYRKQTKDLGVGAG